MNFTSCTAQFLYNRGNNGGAIALLGAAYVVVDEKTVLNFTNKTASLFGGAIFNLYIDKLYQLFHSSC